MDLCRRLSLARTLYRSIAEPVMGHPRSLEHLAAQLAAYSAASLSDTICLTLERLLASLSGDVCVVSPLVAELPAACSSMSVVAVEPGPHNPGVLQASSVVVGDLDGSRGGDLLRLASRERMLLAHVHGDNVYRLLGSTGGRWPDWAVPTSQAVCVFPVLGVGGYTDGDRAVVAAMALSAPHIIAVGFDFEHPQSPHKDSSVSAVSGYKPAKLRVAERIILEAARLYGYSVKRVSSHVLRIEKIRNA